MKVDDVMMLKKKTCVMENVPMFFFVFFQLGSE